MKIIRRILNLLTAAALLSAGAQALAAPSWVAPRNGQLPAGALACGQENGQALMSCRGNYNGGMQPGKMAGQNCNIAWGGKEIVIAAPNYEVLVANPNEVQWVKGQNGSVPNGAFIGGQEGSRQLAVCRAGYNNSVYPGKIVAQNCNIGVGGKEILVPNYEVMVASAATAAPPLPTSSAPTVTAANASDAALSPADTAKVIAWMARQTATAKQPYCYRQSYGRGVGAPLSTCGPGEQKNGLLCYPDCKAGYGGAGPVCWASCPSGYTDTGALCTRPADSYSNSGGSGNCDSGYTNMGLYCQKNSPWFGTREKSCPSGSYYSAGLCKVNCKSGYSNTGLTCYKGPDTVAKSSYGRGAGNPMKCAAGQQEDAGLCYSYCKMNFGGVGPVCWQNCPAGTTNCAAGCSVNASECASKTANMVIAPLILAANIFTLGASSEITAGKAELTAALKAKDITAARAALAKTMTAYASRLAEMTTKEVAVTIQKQFAPNAAKWVAKEYGKTQLYMATKQTDAQLAESYARDLAGLDPTGVAGVVEAFTQSICNSDEPFPKVTPLTNN